MLSNRLPLLAIAGIGDTFGEKFANPTVLPVGTGFGVAFSPAGNAVVVTHNTTPFISAYGWSSSGFGARYANPAVLPNSAPGCVQFTPSGSHVITTETDGLNPSRLVAYQWSPTTGFGAKQTLALFDDALRSLDVSPSGSHIAVVGISAAALKPLVVVPWTGTAFGSPVIASSQTVASGDAVSVKFTPDGSQIAIGTAGNGNLIYPFSGGALGNPSTLPGTSNSARCIAFDSAGNTIYLGQFFSGGTANTRIAGWKRSASGQFNIPIETGTSLLIASAVQSLSMSPLDNLLVAGMSSSVLPLNAYRLSGGSILHRYADPRTMPTSGVSGRQAIAFSPSGDAVAICHQNSPFVTAYKISTN